MFSGLSTLRAAEKQKEQKEETEAQRKMREYLQKYEGGGDGGSKKSAKKKKKKKAAAAPAGGGLLLVDEDVSGFAAPSDRAGPSTLEADDDDDYQPVVVNPEGAERAKRLIEKERDHFKRGDDGSGWALARGSAEGRDKQRHDSPDMSPPRRGQQRHDSPDMSPPRRGQQRHDSPDMSPPRRGQQRHDSPDMSPPRRGQQRHDSPDMSPPRKGAAAGGSGRAPMMSDGTAAGMISGKDLKTELDKKKQHDMKRFKEMDSSVSGRNADTVYRDKSGKRYASRAEYEAAMEEEKAKKKAKHMSEAELAWGGGMKQKRKKAEMAAAMAAEAAAPFARGRDDAGLNASQRDALRWGDPMAHLVAKKQRVALEDAAPSLVDPSNKKNMKTSGFIIPQDIPGHSWMRRGVGAPPNRYSIKPGRHWDGVDRSNGFETKMWKEQQRRAARDTEAFMYMQSDM